MAKKLKKVFALLLTLSMVMSLLSVTALAKSNESDEWKIESDIENSGTIIVKDANDEEAGNVWYWYDTADISTALNKKGIARLDIIDAAVENPNTQKTYYAKAIINGQEVRTEEFTVPYFAALQNGSFEKPVVNGTNIGFSGVYQYKNNANPELVWQTTGLGQGDKAGRDIELVRPSKGAVYHGVQPGDIPDGAQFAELNAEAYGALYQDVLTEPGSTLNWGLSHRGRDGEDTMYVVIVNATNANNVTAPGDVNNDCIVAKITDGNKKWGYYQGEYEVPAGQYVTRFYFLAVSATGGATQGNLLDNVYFTTERPKEPAVTTYDYTVNYFVDRVKKDSFSGAASKGAKIQTEDLSITQEYISNYDASANNVYDMVISAEEENVLDLYFTTKQTPVEPTDPAERPAPVVGKEATDLDENDETTVTLSVGASEKKEKVAVMFLLDKSTSQGMRTEAAKMLAELRTKNNTDIVYDVVIFSGTASSTGWLDIADDEGYEATLENFVNKSTTSGTNMYAGVLQAQEDLKKVPDDCDETYLITLSDGITYVWTEDNTVKCVPVSEVENSNVYTPQAGPDTWKMMYGYGVSLKEVYGGVSKFLDAVPAKITKSKEYVVDYNNDNFAKDNPIKTYVQDAEKTAAVAAEYACGPEFAMYYSATGYAELAANFDYTYAFAVPELTTEQQDNTKNWENFPWGEELMLYLQSISTNHDWDTDVSNADAAKIFANIKNEILYTMQSGTVTDVIGDRFDLKGVDTFTLTVGEETLAGTVSGNTVSFDNGNYTVEYKPATDNSKEQFVWNINTPVKDGEPVKLSYVLKLVDKETTPGDHTALTNEEAVLEYTPTEGDPGEEKFPKPEVEYNVPTSDPKPTPAANLVVDKVAPDTVKQGENLTYTITVENKGDASAKGVVITDTLPDGVELVSASDDGKVDGKTVTWSIGELAAGAKKTVTVVVSTGDVAVGTVISNTAVVTAEGENDPKTDTVETEVKPKDDDKTPDDKDDDDDDDDDDKGGGGSGNKPVTVIPEDPTPMDPGVDIPDPEVPKTAVPKAEVPKTGDAAALWLALAGVSALGLAVVTFTTRKKENG